MAKAYSVSAPASAAPPKISFFSYLDPERRRQQAEWQSYGEVDDLQHPVDRDTKNAERQQQKPNERIGYECQQSQGPAEYEEYAP